MSIIKIIQDKNLHFYTVYISSLFSVITHKVIITYIMKNNTFTIILINTVKCLWHMQDVFAMLFEKTVMLVQII